MPITALVAVADRLRVAAVARDNAIPERILAAVLVGNRMLTLHQVAKLGAYFQVGEDAFPPRERATR